MEKPPTPLTICLIDDDFIYQFTAKRIIQLVNPLQKILVFGNGKEALDYFCHDSLSPAELPDVIFLDINMPVMNGWEFLDEFQCIQDKLIKTITIYMVSSSVDEKDIARSKSFEMVKDFIVKPIHKERMLEIIESLY